MENRDEKLWQIATQRAKFRRGIISYVVVNLFLWCIWYFTKEQAPSSYIPWPAWVSLGWGFGLIMKYFSVYHFTNEDQIQKEYDKLKNKD